MTAQFARAPYRGRSGGGTGSEPHAALLIDFDNVTMGIRSDLTKELKNLLNSDIIKGKVAVQRAYADWRRYPQYIVPLAESSVDLIFAPAYGSAKKNATDIRLAIDAVELVFTRPEIGTIILLSGDSDFSSLVLKLKEYGKYVIGVGIRESASDLLVQNCDEYYSYSALTGLTRAGDEAPVVSEDPWELVEMALRQMIENGDVMRSDRLKQVLLEMDPAFDEKSLGFQKFNKFLQDAANRGIISLRKQENGQFEVGPPSEEAVEAAASAARGDAAPSREGREREGRRRGRRGRGRRDDREREEKPESQLELESTPEGGTEAADASAPTAAAAEAPAASDVPDAPAEEATAPAAVRGPETEAAPAAGDGDGLQHGYDLLRRAMSELTRKGGPVVRDSDVKRRMLELEAGWDESTIGFSKFSRFLRQAHDAQVVTLRKGDNGNYDVMAGDGGALVEEPVDGRGGRRGRGDRQERGRERESRERKPDDAAAGETQPAAESRPAAAQSAAEAEPKAPAAQAPAEAARETPATAPPSAGGAVGFRRGSRGRPAPAGPPPLLEGQTAVISRPAAPAPAEPAPASPEESASTAGTGDEGSDTARKPARKTTRKTAKKTARKAGADTAGKAASAGRGGKPKFDPKAFGLPTTAEAITSYITTEYKGVGPRTVEAVLERVGPDRFFEVLEHDGDLVRDVVGAGRGEKLLETWADDIAFRRANAAPTSAAPRPAEGSARGRGPGGKSGGAKSGGAKKGGAKSGTGGAAKSGARRGGRRGGRRGPAASK